MCSSLYPFIPDRVLLLDSAEPILLLTLPGHCPHSPRAVKGLIVIGVPGDRSCSNCMTLSWRLPRLCTWQDGLDHLHRLSLICLCLFAADGYGSSTFLLSCSKISDAFESFFFSSSYSAEQTQEIRD